MDKKLKIIDGPSPQLSSARATSLFQNKIGNLFFGFFKKIFTEMLQFKKKTVII